MNNIALLDYLKDYVREPQIIVFEKLSDSEKNKLPPAWIDILSYKGNERVNKTLMYWADFSTELQLVLEYMKTNIISINLIHHSAGYSLLYEITSVDKKRTLLYEGRNPKSKTLSPKIAPIWTVLPENIKTFYNELHNGWFYLASESMGLSPVENFFFLEEEEWEILNNFEHMQVNMEKTIAVFTNGMGAYICLEKKKNTLHTLLWWNDEPPTLNLDFWPVVDSWIMMGLEA
jgi:hypothetical protein